MGNSGNCEDLVPASGEQKGSSQQPRLGRQLEERKKREQLRILQGSLTMKRLREGKPGVEEAVDSQGVSQATLIPALSIPCSFPGFDLIEYKFVCFFF